jgi:hypothetical protein
MNQACFGNRSGVLALLHTQCFARPLRNIFSTRHAPSEAWISVILGGLNLAQTGNSYGASFVCACVLACRPYR